MQSRTLELVDLALSSARDFQVSSSIAVAGIEAQGLGEALGRLIEFALAGKDDAEVVVCTGKARLYSRALV